MRRQCVVALLCLTLAETSIFNHIDVISRRRFNIFKPLQLVINQFLEDDDIVTEKWIDQPLNHDDPREHRTFKMRYFENLEYWQPNGPVYMYIGGENEQHKGMISNNEIFLTTQMAKETNGAMFATEHRYYGKSLPNIPKDDPIKYFKYLSSQHALADIAVLIKTLKLNPKFAKSPVVVIGDSYAGNLAAWMRVLYPDVVDAAVAVSAPVLAKKDFHEYLDIVRYTFDTYGTENCLHNIEKTFERYEELLKSASGIEILRNEVNICPSVDLTLLENKQCLFYGFYDQLKSAAAYSPISEVRRVCNQFKSKNKSRLVLSNPTLKRNDSDNCLTIENCWTTSPDDEFYAFTYQYCTEFGYFPTTSSEKQPFVHWNPLEFLLKSCEDFIEGDIEKRIDEGVAKTNQMYGGLSPNVSKVVFTHGDRDPWRALGVQRDLAPDVRAIIANGTTHCDVMAAEHGEPEDLKEIRKYVRELVKNWIANV